MNYQSIIRKLVISGISLALLFLSSQSLFTSTSENNKPLIKIKEYKFENNKLSVFIPNWKITQVDNSSTKIQAFNTLSSEEINFGYEDTNETLESYWTVNYRTIKELNPDNYMTVQDTMIGNLPSKLLYFKAKDTSQMTSCMHFAYWNNKIIHYNYLSKNTNCQEQFFIELSKIALTAQDVAITQ
jgi:hypothetical protein